jgi:hypothetical protein
MEDDDMFHNLNVCRRQRTNKKLIVRSVAPGNGQRRQVKLAANHCDGAFPMSCSVQLRFKVDLTDLIEIFNFEPSSWNQMSLG